MNDSDSSLSRRDALRLAKFGALLATGLTITREAEAGDEQFGQVRSEIWKGEPGAMVIKLYAADASYYFKQIAEVDLPADLVAMHNMSSPTSFMFKIIKTISPTTSSTFAYTIKLTNASAVTIKLNKSIPSE